ncbi:MAG: MgtC/SapB family protein [Bacteroidales bacterium]
MFWDFSLRLTIASALGAVIGLDRTYRAKDAGFRTHILVCLGSALMMIVSQYGFNDVTNGDTIKLDPSRVAAQVVSGIGFIGAGTIIFQKQIVRGLTTAAGLWATAGIGLAIGCGMYGIGIVTTILTLVGLEVVSLIFKNMGIHTLMLQFSTGDQKNINIITAEIARLNGHLVSYEALKTEEYSNVCYRVNILIRSLNNDNEAQIVRFVQQFEGVMVEKID